MANQLFFSCLMLAAGVGIPVMAALSAGVGTRHGSPALAASLVFLVALCISPKQAVELGPILSQYMNENYKPVSTLAAGAVGMLSQLKESGFRLGVVSNRERPYEQEMDQLGIRSLFEFSLAAGEVQSYKPHPGIFEAALKWVETTPEAAMYVGDNYFADVVGARRAGLRPVLYDPSGIYPDADCAVIASFGGLSKLLKK